MIAGISRRCVYRSRDRKKVREMEGEHKGGGGDTDAGFRIGIVSNRADI